MPKNRFLYLSLYIIIDIFLNFPKNNVFAQKITTNVTTNTTTNINCGIEQINPTEKMKFYQWEDSKSFFIFEYEISLEIIQIPDKLEENSLFVTTNTEFAENTNIKTGDLVYVYNRKNKKSTFALLGILEGVSITGGRENKYQTSYYLGASVPTLKALHLDFSLEKNGQSEDVLYMFFPNSNKNLHLSAEEIQHLGKKLVEKSEANIFLEKCILPNPEIFYQKGEKKTNIVHEEILDHQD